MALWCYVLKQNIRIPSREFKNSDYLLLEKIEELINDSKLKKEVSLLKDKVRGVFLGNVKEKLEITNEEKKL